MPARPFAALVRGADPSAPAAYRSTGGSWRLPRAVGLPILALCVLAVGAVVVNEWAFKSVRAGEAELAGVTGTRQDLMELQARLSDADAGLQSFLLSGDRRFLERRAYSLGGLPLIGARLQSEARADLLLRAGMQRLETRRVGYAVMLRSVATLAGQGRRGDALAKLRAGESRAALHAFRQELRALAEVLDSRAHVLRARTDRHVQRFRLAIAVLGLVTLTLLALAVRLLIRENGLHARARHDQVLERRRLEQVVGERTAELTRLTTHLQSVAEQEKAAVARDLHDELGGLLTAARMDVAWLQARTGIEDAGMRSKLRSLTEVIEDAMTIKRRVVENLRPALLDHFGLPAALQSHFEETCTHAGLRCRARIPADFAPVPQDLSIALFRVGQESLTNIIRHAHATDVELSFEGDRHHIRIVIRDNGVGIAADKLDGGASHGLAGMRHRVGTLGGRFVIAACQPRGTRTEVIVPMPRAGALVSEIAAGRADADGRTGPACRGSDRHRLPDSVPAPTATQSW